MAYLGNRNASGENNSFKILDDLAFTTTFNGSDSNVVNHVADTITINNHRFLTGSRVTYSNGGGGNITGLTNGTVYFTIKIDHNTIKLATTAVRAASGTAINITGTGTGTAQAVGTANSEGALQALGNIAITDGALLIDNDISSNINVPSGKNGLLIGTVNVAIGVTIDVATGSVLVVV